MPIVSICFAFAIAGVVVWLIWKADHRAIVLDHLARDKMPVWLSLVLALAAAGGTYIVAPILNQDFEFQKNRSAHLLETETELNKLSIDLAIGVRQFDDSLFYNRKSLTDKRGNLLDKITELQWRLIDVEVVIKRAKADDGVVKSLSGRLDELRGAVTEAKSPEDQERVIDASLKVAVSAKACITALYRAANLDEN